MLENVLKAINRSRDKKHIKLVKGRLFVTDSALSFINKNLADILASDKPNFDRRSSLEILKRHLSDGHYYLLDGGKVLHGYLVNGKLNGLEGIREVNCELINGVEHLVYGDPSLKNSGITLLEKGKHVAEFEYLVGKYKISLGAFNRFVRCYREFREISLRDCLFEMYRCIKKAQFDSNSHINALRKKLERLKVQDRRGKFRLLDGRAPNYLYSRREVASKHDYIFVRDRNEIFYCQPIF